MPKRTYQPKKKKRIRTQGFRARVKKHLKVLKRRMKKGRQQLSASNNKRYK